MSNVISNFDSNVSLAKKASKRNEGKSPDTDKMYKFAVWFEGLEKDPFFVYKNSLESAEIALKRYSRNKKYRVSEIIKPKNT